MAITSEELEKLRLKMVEGRENYEKFMKSHSRPMTEEEKKDDNLNTGIFMESKGTAFEKYESHAEPFIIEFSTYDDAMEAKRVQDEMLASQRAFYRGYKEFKNLE